MRTEAEYQALLNYVKEAAGNESVLLPVQTLNWMSIERERLARTLRSELRLFRLALADLGRCKERLAGAVPLTDEEKEVLLTCVSVTVSVFDSVSVSPVLESARAKLS